MSGKINLDLKFPIIRIVENEVDFVKNIKEYTVCVKSYIPILNKLEEQVLDFNGVLYQRVSLSFIKHINPFKGFSLKAGGQSVCYVEKKIQKIKDFSVEELKVESIKIVKMKFKDFDDDISHVVNKFKEIHDKEEMLKYLFQICSN